MATRARSAILITAALLAAAPGAGRPRGAEGPLADAGRAGQAGLDRLADAIGYRFEVVDNQPASCPPSTPDCFLSELTITTPSSLPPAALLDRVSLYFSFVAPLTRVDSDMFAHAHINGDLQRLTLKPGVRLQPGQSYRLRLWGAGAFLSTAFPMPNAYLAADGLRARTIAASRAADDPETGLPKLAFIAPMRDEARLARNNDQDRTRWFTPERAFALYEAHGPADAPDILILPRPATAERPARAPVDLSTGAELRLRGVARSALAPALAALVAAGVPRLDTGPTLAIGLDGGLPPEGYRLEVRPDGIAITARDAAGAAHALRSLTQQVTGEGPRLRPLTVRDAPRYSFRGLHIDVARNFHGPAQLTKLIEAMAAYKLNRLHLHLADDEGWRIAIPALPELTEVGARRCHDPAEDRCLLPQLGAGPDGTGPVNGYLSGADYVGLVRHAAARGIEVIPSIDMPGHSRAAIRAMEARYRRLSAASRPAEAARFRLVDPGDTTRYRSIQNYSDNTLNPCLPATDRFVGAVLDELVALHRRAGTPLRTFHLGGDETAGAWVESPACRATLAQPGMTAKDLTPRFLERVGGMLTARGLRTAGWSDGLGHTDAARMPPDTQTNIWGGFHGSGVREAHEQGNRGWRTVLSIPDFGYFDMPYAPDPEEGGYTWASRGVSTRQVFAFMPGNLPANAALIVDAKGHAGAVADAPVLGRERRIEGLQAQLWSETIRTDAQVDYMFFPRLLALAERAWSPAGAWEPAYVPGARYEWRDARIDARALDEGWRDFAGRLAAQRPLLDRIGISYRLAPPGARIAGGQLQAIGELPGDRIEYRQAGAAWTPYDGPVAVSGAVELRTRSPDGRRVSRTVTVRS